MVPHAVGETATTKMELSIALAGIRSRRLSWHGNNKLSRMFWGLLGVWGSVVGEVGERRRIAEKKHAAGGGLLRC